MHRLRRAGRAICCPRILRCNNQYMYKIREQQLIPPSTSSLGTAILQHTPGVGRSCKPQQERPPTTPQWFVVPNPGRL